MTPQLTIIIGFIITLILITLILFIWSGSVKFKRDKNYGSNKQVIPYRLRNEIKKSDIKFKTYKITLSSSIQIRKHLQRVDLELNSLKDQINEDQEISIDHFQFCRNLYTEMKEQLVIIGDVFKESKDLFSQKEIHTIENLQSNYKKALDLLNILCLPNKQYVASKFITESIRDLSDLNSKAVHYHEQLIDHFKSEFTDESNF